MPNLKSLVESLLGSTVSHFFLYFFWNTSHLKLLDFFIDVRKEHDQWTPTNAFDIEQSSSKCTNNIRCT